MFYKLQHITHAETQQLCNPTILCCQNRQPRCATSNILSKNAITQNYHINKVAPRASSLTSKATSANNTSSNLGRCPGVFKACHNTENDEEEKQKTYYPTYCQKKSHFHRGKRNNFSTWGFTKELLPVQCSTSENHGNSLIRFKHAPKARTLNPLKHENQEINRELSDRWSGKRKREKKTFWSFLWISSVSAAR